MRVRYLFPVTLHYEQVHFAVPFGICGETSIGDLRAIKRLIYGGARKNEVQEQKTKQTSLTSIFLQTYYEKLTNIFSAISIIKIGKLKMQDL